MKRIAPIAIFILATAQQAVTFGSVSGTILDPAGAFLRDVTISVTNTERNQTQTASTDARGRFRFPQLAAGDYTLRVSARGFAPKEQALRVTIGAALDLPLHMQVAQSESIEVTAIPPLVETARTQLAATVQPEEVRNLPLNGRNYLDLALLVPGVSRTNTGANQRFAETSAVPGTGISISTQRNLANSFIVDGLSANDDAAELAGTFFSEEVIREFAVIRAGGVAEFGRASAGIINIATHSGTNALRGDAYAFVRNQRFDGDNPLTHAKLPLDQKQYGVSAGGPLLRDRTFFFANSEQLRQRGGGVITIAPATAAILNVATGAFDTTLDTTNVFARVDHTASPSDQLTLRVNTYDVSSENARSAGGLNAISRATSLENRDRTLAAMNLWTISSDAISETRGQMTRSRLSAPPNDLLGPAININGVANLGTATNSPTARDIDLQELAQNVMWLRGNHAIKAGLDVLRNDVRISFPGAIQGAYTFTSLANYLAGNYSSFTQAFGEPDTHQNNLNYGVFVQDQWRAADRITVNAGLRYDVQQLPSIVHTDRNNLSPRLGIAWDIRGDGRSVLRATAGIYYDPIPLRAVSNALQRNGVTYRVVTISRSFAGAPVFPNVFPTYPTNVLTNITTMDPNIQNSRSDQAALQFERQIGASTSASIAYEHLRGRDIIMSRNVNVARTNPNFANIGDFESIGDSWYDGMTFAVTKRPVKWGSFRVAYTFSKGLDTSGNFFFSQPQNANDIAAERGRSDNDQRHRLTISGTADAHGWVFSTIFTYASALPFNIQLPNDRNGDTSFNDRPIGVGRNAGRGFDYQSLDLRLSRRLGPVEGIVDVFNALNRANYQVPNNIITSPTFGKPTAANDPREVQVGLRIVF